MTESNDKKYSPVWHPDTYSQIDGMLDDCVGGHRIGLPALRHFSLSQQAKNLHSSKDIIYCQIH